MNWYYESAGQQQGPVADSELDRLLGDGKITLDTLVWREGMAGWTPLRTARPAAPPPVANIEDSDPGWEVTRPGTPLAPQASAAAGSDAPQPGWVRCSLTGKYFPPSEIIYLEGKPYSAAAKPQVVASMQTGGVLPTSEVGRDGPAWEHRAQLGMMKAIIETVKAVLMEPTKTFSTMKREGGIQDPLIYNLIVGSIGGILLQLMMGVVQMLFIGSQLNQQGGSAAPAFVGMGVGFAINLITVPVSVAMGAFIGSGVLHLCLMMLKSAPRPFETTFRAFNYANGSVGALYAVPVLGIAVAPIWGLVVLCIGVARAQEVPTGKVVAAVFLPMVVCCGLGVIAAIAIGALGAAGGAFK